MKDPFEEIKETKQRTKLDSVTGGQDENKVVEFRNPSPHDIKIKDGQILKFELRPAHGHFDVVYFVERTIKTPFGEKEIKEATFTQCIELKWWEKLIGKTIDDKVMEAVTYYKKFVADVQAAEEEAEKITQRVNAASRFMNNESPTQP